MAGVPMDQRDGWIWMDGELVAWKDAKAADAWVPKKIDGKFVAGQESLGGGVREKPARVRQLLAAAHLLILAVNRLG